MIKLTVRECLHFLGGLFLAVCAAWILQRFCPAEKGLTFMIACLIGAGPGIREIRDFKKGQSVKKTIADLAAWGLGAVTGAYIWVFAG